LNAILHDVKFAKDLWINIFSINQALKKGHKISNDRIAISWSKGLTKISFDSVFKAKNGAVWGVKMIDYNTFVADSPVNTDLKKM
jgi:hypothetical protein